jgi:putative hydrolase of the HAD superfamily
MVPAGSHPRPVRGPSDAILLDLYGTLIPAGTRAARRANLRAMAEVLGVDPEPFAAAWLGGFDPRTRGQWGNLEATVAHVAQLQGATPEPERVRRAVQLSLEFFRPRFAEPHASTLRALDRLRAAGFRLALVSDASEESPRLWSDSPLRARFDAAVFSCEMGVRKPDPRMYRTALERLAVPAERAIFVGDGGSQELPGAEAVGLAAYLYRYPEEDEESAFRVDASAEWTGPRLRDLEELLAFAPGPR